MLASAHSSAISAMAGSGFATLHKPKSGGVLGGIDAVILLIISHLLRYPFAKATSLPDGQHDPHQPFRRLDARRRRAGAGRAEPSLFLPRAPRHGTGGRRRRGGPARPARGDRRGLGA